MPPGAPPATRPPRSSTPRRRWPATGSTPPPGPSCSGWPPGWPSGPATGSWLAAGWRPTPRPGNPTDSELAHLAELHRAANDLDGLATTLARRVASAPLTEVAPLQLDLAALLARLGREPEAVEGWRAVLRVDPVALEPLRALLRPPRAALLHDGERESLLATLAGPRRGGRRRAGRRLGGRGRGPPGRR